MGKDEYTPLEWVMAGNLDKGIEAFRKAKIQNAEHYFLSENYLNNVGYSLLHEKKNTKAIDVFKMIALLYPEDVNVYNNLGGAYREAGQKAKAKEAYLKALKIDPENINAAKALKEL